MHFSACLLVIALNIRFALANSTLLPGIADVKPRDHARDCYNILHHVGATPFCSRFNSAHDVTETSTEYGNTKTITKTVRQAITYSITKTHSLIEHTFTTTKAAAICSSTLAPVTIVITTSITAAPLRTIYVSTTTLPERTVTISRTLDDLSTTLSSTIIVSRSTTFTFTSTIRSIFTRS